jgi:hypothetical protein
MIAEYLFSIAEEGLALSKEKIALRLSRYLYLPQNQACLLYHPAQKDRIL